MGWFWNSSSSSSGSDDPTKYLDSGFKDYLKKASPAAYQLPQVTDDANHSSRPESSSWKVDPSPATPESSSNDESTSKIPSGSLYKDGRYDHLWKTYQPLEAVEKQGATTSNAEKVIEQFKRRKAKLNETALENCAEEHEALSLCFKRGGAGARAWAQFTLCRDENAKFSRCYTMQTKFLQALGYASSMRTDSETEERIQMHADKLYHQMLDYERRIEEAKAAGEPVPPPESLFHPKAPTTTTIPSEGRSGQECEVPGGETLPPGMKFSKPANKLTPHERELEIRMARQQLEQQDMYKMEVNDLLIEEEEAKRLRQRKMSTWFGETVAKWLS
ncbi:hypothetical protein KEM54_005805 [Ascosphaera aggregata]|nr:hypothetical protein KEM54_005805 [Ascosphaera aggregata]